MGHDVEKWLDVGFGHVQNCFFWFLGPYEHFDVFYKKQGQKLRTEVHRAIIFVRKLETAKEVATQGSKRQDLVFPLFVECRQNTQSRVAPDQK